MTMAIANRVPLASFSEITVGFAFKSDQMAPVGVRLLRGANVAPGKLDWTDVRYWDTDRAIEFSNLTIAEGDVVLAMDRPVISSGLKIACATRADLPALLVQRVARIRNLRGPNKYLYYALSTNESISSLVGAQTGTQLPHISGSGIGNVRVPLPSAAEQHRIVAAIETHFSRLDASVAALTRAKANVKRARASVLKAAVEGRLVHTEAALARAEARNYEPASVLLDRILAERKAAWAKSGARGKYQEPVKPETAGLPGLPEGWVWATIPQLAAQPTGLFSDGDWVESQDQDPSGTVRLTQLADVGDGWFRDRSDRWINDEQAQRLNVTYLRHGDVLVARMPDPLGRACVVPRLSTRAITVVDVCIVRAPSVLSRWLMHTINSAQNRSRISALQAGSTRKRISRANLGTIPLPLPPLAEQHRIVAEVDRRLSVLDALDASIDANLARCARLRQAVLKRAFEGRLVPAEGAA